VSQIACGEGYQARFAAGRAAAATCCGAATGKPSLPGWLAGSAAFFASTPASTIWVLPAARSLHRLRSQPCWPHSDRRAGVHATGTIA
jgi:hypothetical protein